MKVIKRNGIEQDFNVDKILIAVIAAFSACGHTLPKSITKQTFLDWYESDSVTVEQIQNDVEEFLMAEGYYDVAKAYILYREKHKTIREFAQRKIDFIHNYEKSDNTANATIDDNSNVANHNIAVMNSEIHKEDNQIVNLRILEDKLKELYPDFDHTLLMKDLNSIAYLHDSSSQIGMPYCVAISMYPFLLNGIKELGGLSAKPQNLDSFCGMFINLVFAVSSQFKGACMHHSQNLLIDNKIQNIKDFISQFDNGWTKFLADGQEWEMCIPKEKHFISEEQKLVSINKVYRRKYNDSIYKVTTKLGNTCSVTKDHIFKVVEGGKIVSKKASELSLYETVVINNNLSNYLDINSLEYKRNYCLGMLLGDGCFTRENKVILSVAYDQEYYLDLFNSYSQEVFGYELNKNKGHKCWNAQKCSKEYKDSICSYLTGKYTKDKNIKSEYLQTVNECCGFLDGLMSADGAYRHAYGISLINKDLINSCIAVLELLNVPYTYSITEPHDNKQELYNLSFSSVAKVYLPNFVKKCKEHKGSNFIYYISNKSKKSFKGDPDTVDTSRRGNNKMGKLYELDVVTSIDVFNNDEDYVYELETSSHWYSCGGIITHNCATPGIFLCMDYFCRKEWGNDYYKNPNTIITSEICTKQKTIVNQIHQYFQQIVYSLMQPSNARGSQSVFWNCSIFDKPFFDTMYGDFKFPDGTPAKWESLNWLQKDFLHWFNQERLKCILTFPVVSVCLIYQNDKFIDSELAEFVAKEYSEGNSFFTYISDSADSLSSCCRLSSKIEKPQFNFTNGQLSEMTGSKNVITLNLNRIIQDYVRLDYQSDICTVSPTQFMDTSSFKEYLIDILERIYKYQMSYNAILEDLYNNNMLSVYKAGFISLNKQYLTIGINGLNQSAEFIGIKCNKNDDYERFCNLIFDTIKEQNKLHSTSKIRFNTEFTPCESAAIKLYNRDKENGYWVPEDTNLYASYIFKPNDSDISVLDKLYLHGNTFCGDKLDGGSACHINLDTHLSIEQYRKLLKYAAEVGCKYFTFNIPNCECDDCGFIAKQPFDTCPKCGSKHISLWDRVIGYLTKIKNWSKGRQIEQRTRVYTKKDNVC